MARQPTGFCKPVKITIGNLINWDMNLRPEIGQTVPPSDSGAYDLALTCAELHTLMGTAMSVIPMTSTAFVAWATSSSSSLADARKAMEDAAFLAVRWWRLNVESGGGNMPGMLAAFGLNLTNWDSGVIPEYGQSNPPSDPEAYDLAMTCGDLRYLMSAVILGGVPNTSATLVSRGTTDVDRALAAILLIGRMWRMIEKASGIH